MAKSDFTFFHPLRVRYVEVDAQGIVYNAHYLTYFDLGVTEYFRALPYSSLGQVERTGTDFHAVKAVVEYQAPLYLDEKFEVYIRTARIGRTSLTFEMEIYGQDDDLLRTRGELVWVNTDQSSHKSSLLPQDLVALLRAKEGLS